MGGPEVPCLEGPLYSVVQCIMGNGHIGPPQRTDTYENITFPQLCWRWGGGGKENKIQFAHVARIQSSTDMSYFAYACKTKGKNDISNLIPEMA